MKIVIVGAGQVGFQIAEQLINAKKDVVLIEKDFKKAKYASSHLDCTVLQGEGNNIEILNEAGIHKAEFFISVTDSDEINMISCGLVSEECDGPYKIARVRNLDYSRSKIFEDSFLGINYIVNPEVEAAKVIANTVKYGATSDVMLFEKSDIQMRNIYIDGNSFFKDKSLIEIKKKLNEEFLIACLSRKENIIIPSGKIVIQEGDNIYIFATEENLEKVFTKIGRSKKHIRNIVLVGCGRIGNYVARYLIQQKRNIKIIDSDYENCKLIAEKFPEATIIHADISDEDIFEEEQLSSYDLMITTTRNQELNILAATYAKTMGVKRTIALVTKTNYLKIAADLGIDSTVSPKDSSVDTILKVIRRGKIDSIHSIFGGKAEIIELSVDDSIIKSGSPIKKHKIPENTLIVSITRDNKTYIPDGDFIMQAGDNVIIVASKESIPQIEEIFSISQ
ncbi:MAG: Trk system potassium transporter TrkA [Spirochaetota bacterium]|nr:Trk system potassium transporter TrkA [Spirochaetota bacterium]